jgi:hypothetical protein
MIPSIGRIVQYRLDTYWATWRQEGVMNGQWSVPPRV